MPQVLKWMAQQTKVYTINFLYNELEDFRVTTSFRNVPVEDAIRQAIGFYPIQMKVDKERRLITVECLHPTAKRFIGVVVDEQDRPLEFANVALLNLQDSAFITGGVTNQGGRFVIPCKHDQVWLKVSHIGYETRTMACRTGEVGRVQLHASTQQMTALTIAGKAFIDNENGYTLHTNQTGMQASDMLGALPHLSLRDNHYYIDGQQTTGIYVDGQPINGLGELCHLSSDMISQVKVDYLSRTVRIILRRPKPSGFYGSVDGSAFFLRNEGYSDRSFGAVWYSRHGGLSIYDRYGVEIHEATDEFFQMTSSPNSANATQGFISPERTLLSNRLSLTQQFNERHSLGISYYTASNEMTAYSNTYDTGNGNSSNTYYEGNNHYNDHEGTLRYDALLGHRNLGLHLIADVYKRNTKARDLSLYGAGVGTESGESPSILLERYSAEMDIPKRAHLGGRVGIDVRGFSSSFDPDQFVSNFKGATTLTYPLKVDGWMPQIFGEAQGQWKSLMLDAGCRLQANLATYRIGDFYETDIPTSTEVQQISDYQQWSVSPYLRLTYPFGHDKRHHLTLSYQHELEEIPYVVMSPFIRWSDAFNYSVGNPELRAPRFHLAMLSASFWQDALHLSAGYKKERNEIFWQSFASQGQKDIFYTRPTNLSATQAFTMHAESRIRPLPCWQLKAEVTLDIRPENQTMHDVRYDQLRLHQHYALRNDLHFEKGWTASANFTLEPTYHIYDRTYHTQYMLSGKVGKAFFRNRLQASVEFDALGNRRHLDRQIGNVSTCFKHTNPVQSIGIRLAWNFSGGKKVKVRTTEGEQAPPPTLPVP